MALLSLLNADLLLSQDRLLPVFHFNRLTTADGLPSNEIQSNVVRDRQGFIWVGTLYGLARYDGYSCKVYREFRTPGNAIRLHIDAKGRLWVGRYSSGLSLYDPLNDRFINFLPRRGDSLWFPGQYIGSFLEDDKGTLWLGFADGQIARLDLGRARDEVRADSVAIHLRFRTINDSSFKGWVERVTSWDEKSILVSSGGGLFLVDQKTGRLSRPHLPKIEGLDPDTILVPILFRENPKRLWIGTRSHGLILFDRSTGTLTGFHKRSSDRTKPNDPRIQDIQIDRAGRMWVATADGVDLFDPISGEYKDFLSASRAPGKSQFSQMSLDSTGTVWISTYADGVFFVLPSLFSIPTYALRGSSGGPMKVETIDRWTDGSYWIGGEGKLANIRLEDLKVLHTVDLFQGEKPRWDGGMTSFNDSKGRIWYGTWGLGMYSFEPSTGRIRNFRSSHQLSHAALGEDVCASIGDMIGDTLLIAGFNETLLAFDTRFNRFSKLLYPTAQPLHLLRDTAGKIWISDEFLGLFLLDPPTRNLQFFEHDPNNPRSLSDSHPRATYQDPAGRIWIGCKDLNLWEPDSRSFRSFPNNTFSEALRAIPLGTDGQGNLWVSYDPNGISLLRPAAAKFTNLDYSDGLAYPRIMKSLQDGRVVLAGNAGVVIVHPDSLPTANPAPPFVFTTVTVNDTTFIPSAKLASDAHLDLAHDKNVLEFGFAAIDPGASHLIRYVFRLDGLENTWLVSGDRRSIRYAGLSPGNYVFMAKAISALGRWPDQEIALAITIAPPWWRSWWAYGGYAFVFIALLTTVYQVRVRQLSLRHQAEHLEAVDRLKSRFFANISHEFRTPLTLILGPVRKWKGKITVDSEELQKDLSMVERNALRLLRLINQLLDLSKLEAGAMKLRACRMNIVPLVKGIAFSFESSANLRRIGLKVVVEQEEIEVYYDRDMVEKILTNLVSNAFKFTPEGGMVTVTVSELTPNPPLFGREGEKGGEFVVISVSDTGAGIAPEHVPRIFDRFYQVDESQTREHEGSGIGLALVKELVELHHGTIHVKSDVGRGSEFIVRLPLGRSHLKDEEIIETPLRGEPEIDEGATPKAENYAEATKQEPEAPVEGDRRRIILVVEDNSDVRDYIRSFLVSPYQVLEAPDGAAGIEKAREIVPDLVISDVMMPKKDGYEVCTTLKLDEKTSHIPVILLTAKAASENKIEGLETGADDYLVKPFEPKELLARIRNLIDVRRRLRERFSAGRVLKPGEITVNSIDDAFLQKVKTVVETHISEEGFGGEDLCKEVGMSRSQIHRKLTALTGLPAGEFIRYLRLHRAMDLLRQNAATVSEIAYMVGFSSPAYFTKCFHEQFGTTPSEIRQTQP